MSTGARPQGGRGIDHSCDGIRRRFVVHSPSDEISPGILVRPLEWKIDTRQALDGFDEFLVGEGDAVVRVSILRDREATGPGDGSEATEPAAQTQSGRDRSSCVGYE